ncbi:MAG: ABC transporter permease [Lachnospiraceae bacterium]|nr:ABC transporter permease [Lachnospiraceae bacterium]
MAKYVARRLIHGFCSVVVVIAIIMLLVYGLLDKSLIFGSDDNFTQLSNNQRQVYKYRMWEQYGYLDYVTYADYLNELLSEGEIDEETYNAVVTVGRTAEDDTEEISIYVEQFKEYYESQGYTVERLDAVLSTGNRLATGGSQQYFAYRNKPLVTRLVSFFTSLLNFDSVNYATGDVGERGLTFTLYDPAYGGEKFSPAIIGNGTLHKYLLYFDSNFPFIHQNFVTLTLGKSYSINYGVDVFTTMTQKQGSYVISTTYYPTGLVEDSADDMHSAIYVEGSLELNLVYADRYTDDYTSVNTVKGAMSKIAFSFVIGIFSSILSYAVGLPLGILMAYKKDTWIDQLGNAYIIFMIAVPSLAYVFMFKAISGKLGLPTNFVLDSDTAYMFVTAILSSGISSIGGQMKWMRRYMVDQMNSNYVKFARSCGLSEGKIYTKHIFKNAAIPVMHGIPGTFVMALSGSIIVESVYVIPGIGGLLVQAIGAYDNSVVVGVALFYGILQIISSVLGDVLMAVMDPRISFTSKAR